MKAIVTRWGCALGLAALLGVPMIFPATAQASVSFKQSTCVNPDPSLTATTSSSTTSCSSAGRLVKTYSVKLDSPPTGFTDDGAAWVAIPTNPAPSRPHTLLVVLPGTYVGSNADRNTPYYSYFMERAAYDGYAAVIVLPYPNGQTIGSVCGTSASIYTWAGNSQAKVDSCYTNTRGEAIYGQSTPYSAGQSAYNVTSAPGLVAWSHISATDSVVNRLVLWLSYLRTHPLGSEPGSYWGQFLKADTTSPYDNTALTVPTGADGGYYPVWGTASSTVNIELAGHSQGGGAAAFVASTLPTNVQIRRVIMLSSPQDSYSYNGGTSSPAWIRSSTIGSRAWGLRHGQGTGSSDEGNYGNTVSQNWSNFGAAVSASPLTGNEDVLSDSADAGCLTNSGTVSNPSMTDCTSLPNLSTSTHRYVIADPQLPADSPDLNAHDSTAANSYLTNGRTSNSIGWGVCTSGEDCSVLNPNEAYIWDRMLTGN